MFQQNRLSMLLITYLMPTSVEFGRISEGIPYSFSKEMLSFSFLYVFYLCACFLQCIVSFHLSLPYACFKSFIKSYLGCTTTLKQQMYYGMWSMYFVIWLTLILQNYALLNLETYIIHVTNVIWICDTLFKNLYGCSYHLIVQRAFVFVFT